jgi:hypothetical protein
MTAAVILDMPMSYYKDEEIRDDHPGAAPASASFGVSLLLGNHAGGGLQDAYSDHHLSGAEKEIRECLSQNRNFSHTREALHFLLFPHGEWHNSSSAEGLDLYTPEGSISAITTLETHCGSSPSPSSWSNFGSLAQHGRPH